MIKAFWLLVFLCVVGVGETTLMAQQIQSTAGETLKNAQGQIDFTLGQAVVNTNSTLRQTSSDGVHQTVINILLSAEDKSNAQTLKIYPNPAKDIISLQFAQEVSGWSVDILNVKGERLLVGKLEGTQNSLTVSHLPSGIYFLQLRNPANHILHSVKLLKQ